ncbi:helix-turn-helix domain-containing protein [Kluyvera georgiana]|uniref:helix-turn-helix domain-containing protein n=1 Tax=Kluyvera georgiana TaxID=73098 RepID=UPI003F677E43
MATSRGYGKDATLLETLEIDETAIYFNRMKNTSADYYHFHECPEMLFITRGIGIAVAEHQQFTVKPGRLFIFPPGRVHKIYVEQGANNQYHRTTLHFNSTLLEPFFRDFPRLQILLRQLSSYGEKIRIFDVSAIQPMIEMLLERFDGLGHDGLVTINDSALLLMQLISFLPGQELENALHSEQNAFSASIIRWIEEHFQEHCSLEALAAASGCSEGHASRRFRRETGGTLQEYLIMRRIRHACEQLVHTTLSVREVGKRSGFTEYAWFITSFRKYMAKTPLQYRKSYSLRG